MTQTEAETPVETPQPAPSRAPSLIKSALTGIAIVAVVLLLVTQRTQLLQAIEGLRHLKWWWVLAAIVLESLSMTAFARLQRRMLRAGGTKLPLRSALAITYAGNAISVSLPLAGPEVGSLFAYKQFQRRGATQVTAAWVVLASGVVSSLAFTAVVITGALVSTNPAAATAGLIGGLGLIIPLTLGLIAIRVPAVAAWLERLGVRVLRLGQRVIHKPAGDAQTFMTRVLHEVSSLHLRRRSWVAVVMLSLVNWLADAGCLAAAVRAAGLPLPFRSVLLVWSAAAAASTLNLTPGGLGVVEAALIAAVVAAGLPTTEATTAVLTYRLISFWLVLAVGWVVYPIVQRRGSRTRELAVEEA